MRTIEPVFESPVRPAVEQTAKTLRPSVPQTPEIAPALAAVPIPPEAARITEPSDEEIRLRAYFISEHRRRFALPGDEDSDWREAKQQLLSESGELMPPEAARITEPSDEEIRLRAYFISESRRRFALPGDEDSHWREAKQQLLSESGELSGLSTIRTEAPSEIPARTEEIALPTVVTPAETEVAPIEEGQPASHEAYRKAEPDGELPPLTEPVFESPVRPAVEQTAKTLRPSVPQTPEIAPALAAVPIPPEAARITEPSDEEILEIPARTEEIALPAVVTSAETQVGSIEGGEPMAYETTFTAIQSPAAEAVTESASDCPNAISPEPVFPQTTAPATMPETTQMPTAPVNKPPATAVAKPQPSGTMQTSVQLTFSFEIAAMQLTPTFKMGVLQVRPISKIVTMRLAPFQQPQPEVSFEIAKIQPVGETLGTIRVIPSQQQRPIMGSPSIAGLQLVPSVEATPIQLTPSQQGQAAVFVTVPCQISTIEFSPSFEIASFVLDSNSKQVFVQLPGANPSSGERAPIFEIGNLQLGESGEIALIELNLVGHGPTGA